MGEIGSLGDEGARSWSLVDLAFAATCFTAGAAGVIEIEAPSAVVSCKVVSADDVAATGENGVKRIELII